MLRRILVLLSIVCWVGELAACQHGMDVGFTSSTFRSAGISEADAVIFQTMESKRIIRLGTRNLTVMSYRAPGEGVVVPAGDTVPHYAVCGSPCIWGFGPVLVAEGNRIVLWNKRQAWWTLTDLRRDRGISLLVAYDNSGGGGPIELHVYQEPQEGQEQMKWWFCVWIPHEMSIDGIMLRVVHGDAPVELAVEKVEHGKLRNIGVIAVDKEADAIRLYWDRQERKKG